MSKCFMSDNYHDFRGEGVVHDNLCIILSDLMITLSYKLPVITSC